MSSETTRLRQLEKKSFDKFGFTFTYGIAIEHHKKWVKVYRDEQGMQWTEENLSKITDPAQMPKVTLDWEDSGTTCATAYVEYARINDPSENLVDAPIEIWGTIEGPLMGIVDTKGAMTPDHAALIDPCVVIYDGKSKINLVPVFNVARKLTFVRDAIRTVQPPSEILLALYPGFIIQNRMAQYQLKPRVPLMVSPELSNDAELAKH